MVIEAVIVVAGPLARLQGRPDRLGQQVRHRGHLGDEAAPARQGGQLQMLTAPRGALLYPRLSREEFEGRFLGLMPYLELKGEGNRSMAGN